MNPNYKIYLICYSDGHPIDFLLPVYTETQFTRITEIAGTCFKIQDKRNAEIVLACRKNGKLHTTRINIESACKENSNISFSVVTSESNQSAFLRAFTDKQHNAFYPIPSDFMKHACKFT